MSIWILERVFYIGKPEPLAMIPFSDKLIAESRVSELRKMYGGDFRAVEYRRVEPETAEGV